MRRILLVVAMTTIATACATQKTRVGVELCYLPFRIATFGPVTRESINKEKCALLNDSDSEGQQLLVFLSEDAQSKLGSKTDTPIFDEKRVRLKFVNNTGFVNIFVDADGVVSNGAKLYRLSDLNKESINSMLVKYFHYENLFQ